MIRPKPQYIAVCFKLADSAITRRASRHSATDTRPASLFCEAYLFTFLTVYGLFSKKNQYPFRGFTDESDNKNDNKE